MFDSYFAAQTLDPRGRGRLMTGALSAALLCGAAGTATFAAQQLAVHRVAAPHFDLDVAMHLGPEPPPLPKPATQPQGRSGTPDAGPAPPVRTPAAAPLETLPDPSATPNPNAPPTTGDRTGPTNKQLFNTTGTCLPGLPCTTDKTIGDGFGGGGGPVRQPEPEVIHETIIQLRARAQFDPAPAQRELAQTPTSRGARRSGVSTVAFCVDTAGKVTRVRTKRRFPGDSEVDRVCRDTVRRWRFTPMRVDGVAKKTCSHVTFEIEFE